MARSLLFVGWMTVLWGSFVLAAFAWKAISEGWGPALTAVVPLRHSDGWAWINLACGVVAVCVWSAVAVVLVRLDRD
jgi:hypothetical protein